FLLVAGLFRELRTPWVTLGPMTKPQQVFCIVLGVALLVAALFADRGSHEPQIVGNSPSSPPSTQSGNGTATRADPQTLITIIRTEQRRAVRESFGLNA